MKNKNLTLLSLVIFSTSPLAFSQSYSGSVAELNAIFDPPMDISESICISNGDANAKSAC